MIQSAKAQNPANPLPADDAVTALMVLGWIVAEPARAQRFLDLTGQSADDVRTRADHPALWSAAMAFVMGHEPDLIACADQLGAAPGDLAACARRLTEPNGTSKAP